MLASFPSPPANGVSLGPLRLHVYGLLIAAGVAACVWLTQRRWRAIGGADGVAATLAVWGVPGGIIGARIYSLATSWQFDTGGNWLRAFAIWEGGLGIWGGIGLGVLTGCIGARRHHLRLAPLFDAVAPGLVLAQAIGRWGNYFNQELYGRRTSLPWGVRIDSHGVVGTFQPTFLYESLWDLVVVGLLIAAERRLRIKRGWLLALYAALYTVGRFWTEYLRIDPAHKIGPLRLNDWVSIGVFSVSVALLVWRGRAGPGDERAGDPLRPGEPGTHPLGQREGRSDGERDGERSLVPAKVLPEPPSVVATAEVSPTLPVDRAAAPRGRHFRPGSASPRARLRPHPGSGPGRGPV